MKRVIASIATALVLTGCAVQPRGAAYVPLVDMKGRDQASFTKDVKECQIYAQQRMNGAEGAVAGALAGALLGAALAPRGHRNYVAARTGGIGAAAGGARATQNQESIIQRCLAGRGYNVLD